MIICEVKSNPEQIAFNEPMRTNPEAIQALLRWAGIFDEKQVIAVADSLQPLLQDNVEIELSLCGVKEGDYRIRGLLCCPPALGQICEDRWCLVGSEIFRFANQCFNPPKRRTTCSTRYNFQQWGYALAPIVEYFKDEEGNDPTLDGLYKHLQAI